MEDEKLSQDVVSLGVYRQVAWERDIAISQLKDLGYDLGEKLRYDDTISRQMAIDAVEESRRLNHHKDGKEACAHEYEHRHFLKILLELPSIMPEIIHCQDCKHFIRDDVEELTPYGFYNTYFHAFCDKHWNKEQGEYIDVNVDDYCSFAERKDNG